MGPYSAGNTVLFQTEKAVLLQFKTHFINFFHTRLNIHIVE